MRALYADAFGLRVLHEAPGVVWLADGAELHGNAEIDDYHAFFGTGPVPGLLVDDYDAAVRRLTEHDVQWLTEPDTAGGRITAHLTATSTR